MGAIYADRCRHRRGRVAIAHARVAQLPDVFAGERWQPWWASTGTKDPAYSDVRR